jgi:AcrR family transcriptional regulator
MREDVLAKALDDPRGTAARILDAAEEVFAQQGYGAASTREMARRARVPFGAVHYHWGSKQELWEGVFRRLTDRTRETLARNVVAGKTAGETMDNLVDAFMDLLIARPETIRLLLRIRLEPPERLTPALQAMSRQLNDLGLAILREHISDGSFDGATAILVISSAFIAALADVAAQQELLGGDVYTSRPARERLRRELKRVARLVFEVRE